ncbi:MAG: arsenate reductase [Xanthomonadaceae bacterium]|nr:arsenate reductase [Xanthomonadaceae bacterium]MDE1959352.1 arsenate reductase [Xanthomonadaceae bacterium]MDE2177133.1 arsenate reductase [Xanthomonadaceae bacterium]
MRLTLYGLVACDTCGKAQRWLQRFGHECDFVDLAAVRPDVGTLLAWAAAAGGWEALVDRGGSAWQRLLPARRRPASDPEWTLLIREHPAVLRHPLAWSDDGRIGLGFSGGQYEQRYGKS